MATPNDILKVLTQIQGTFPKSSKMFVGFIEQASKTGAFEGATQRGSVSAMKNAWQLEDKPPTIEFAPTDEAVVGYVRRIAESTAQSPCKMLVIIDLSKGLTSVWVVPKGMCFIATAAYGSPFAKEVVVLSRFRDEVLLRSKVGTLLVRLYYAVSPTIASYIDEKKAFKVIIRTLLAPITCLVRTRMNRQ